MPLRKRKNTQTYHVFEGKNITGIDNCCPWAYFTAEKIFQKNQEMWNFDYFRDFPIFSTVLGI